MNRQFVCETTFAGLRPLGIGGRRIQESWHEIDAALRSNLGDPYARLFAEPVPGEGTTSWFAQPEGEVVGYRGLDDAAKRALIRTVEARLAAMRAKVAEFKASGRPAQRRLGETLDRLMSFPGPLADREILFAIRTASGDEPVLVNWGTRDDVPDPPLAALEDFLRGEALRLHLPQPPAETASGSLAPDDAAVDEIPDSVAPVPPALPAAPAPADPPEPDDLPGTGDAAPDEPDRPLSAEPYIEPYAGPREEPPWLQPEPRLRPEAVPDEPGPEAPRPEATAAPPGRARLWPWVLLLGALLAAIVLALLPTCGVLVPFLAACQAPDTGLAELRREGEDLERQLHALQQQVAALPRCEPIPGGPAPAAAQAPRQSRPVEPAIGLSPEPQPQGSEQERRSQITRLDQAVAEAGGTVGPVTVTLQWQAACDLDLRVYCPNGTMVDFQLEGQPQQRCGRARLDVDANVADDALSANPIENVSWPEQPPPGRYRIEVHNFKSRPPNSGPVPFVLRVRVGEDERLIEGSILPGERRSMYEFSIP
ncbi:MAG TPA: hypothetical protein VNS22_23415 [Geminicoccus sp.]|uniref:hypothetical protein n=1 Tax=Geminicoccus sp. TaxID=2024832 RepID=UPI002C8FDAEB|nr:hypothetical protein [Geminicoccus sp.]HWL71307.1 hypothetical protein [Geminicoccus sp.]